MKFFWLHIKKLDGQTLRNVLSLYYKVVDHSKYPKYIIQATQYEYNDVLKIEKLFAEDFDIYENAIYSENNF